MTNDDRVRHALWALAEADRARHAPSRVERAVLEAFDRSVHERHAVRTRAVAWPLRLSAVAAVLLFTTFSAIYLVGRDHRAVATRADQSRAPAAHDDVRRSSPSSQEPVASRGDQQRHRLSHARAPVPQRNTDRDADLTVSSNGESDGVVRVVRMRLPRASLQLLGIPIIDPDAVGTTEVELLVGEDGLARTIRMVR